MEGVRFTTINNTEAKAVEITATDSEGKKIGFIQSTYNRVKHKYAIHNLEIQDGHRRKGLGKIIVDMVLKILKQNNVELVFADIEKDNMASRTLAAEQGFIELEPNQGEDPTIIKVVKTLP